MRRDIRYHRQSMNRSFLPVACVLFVFFIFLFQAGAGSNHSVKSLFSLPPLAHAENCPASLDLNSIDGLIGFNSYAKEGPLIKQRTTHPLSQANRNKTRPRGVPGQSPDTKNIYLPDHLVFYCETSQTIRFGVPGYSFFLRFLESNSIRPPPSV